VVPSDEYLYRVEIEERERHNIERMAELEAEVVRLRSRIEDYKSLLRLKQREYDELLRQFNLIMPF
jgi:hypothetical protein